MDGMFHSLFNPLLFPNYQSVAHLEGKGYAVKKYYKWPWRPFYRQKVRMISDELKREYKYRNILDFGAGPGLLTRELGKHGWVIKTFNKGDVWNPVWKFDAIVCASSLEFTELDFTLKMLKGVLSPNGVLVIASPMETSLSRLYFWLIGDKTKRHSHEDILAKVSKHFKVVRYRTWLNLYFSIKARQL